MQPLHLKHSPQSKYVRQEDIIVKTLDSIFDRHMKSDEKIFLKIDTQGYEKKVIAGSLKSLKYISGIQMEMSLAPLYKGESLLLDIINYMSELGYELMSLEPGWANRSGQLLQIDGIFFRKSSLT